MQHLLIYRQTAQHISDCITISAIILLLLFLVIQLPDAGRRRGESVTTGTKEAVIVDDITGKYGLLRMPEICTSIVTSDPLIVMVSANTKTMSGRRQGTGGKG